MDGPLPQPDMQGSRGAGRKFDRQYGSGQCRIELRVTCAGVGEMEQTNQCRPLENRYAPYADPACPALSWFEPVTAES